MTILDLLKGRKIKVMTDAMVEIELIIDSVKVEHHYEQTGPSNAQNDWWPDANEWDTFDVKFTNGFKTSYRSINDLKLVD